jgi:hypothetical protein
MPRLESVSKHLSVALGLLLVGACHSTHTTSPEASESARVAAGVSQNRARERRPQPSASLSPSPSISAAAVPYDAAKAPTWFVQRRPLRSCGAYVFTVPAALPRDALRCFTAALGAGGVEFASARRTTEGDPVVTYVRALPGTSTAVVITDSTRDRFGPQRWSSETCVGFNVGTLMAKRCRPLTQR